MAREMFAKPRHEKSDWGFDPEDFAVQMWPDTLEAHNLLAVVSTQWRVGPGGPYGLDYNVLYRKMDRMSLTSERYDELEAEIRVMESAAIESMHEK